MFCKYCGTENVDGAVFCAHCGAKMVMPVMGTTEQAKPAQTASVPASTPKLARLSRDQRNIAAILTSVVAVLAFVVALAWKAFPDIAPASDGGTIISTQPKDEAEASQGDIIKTDSSERKDSGEKEPSSGNEAAVSTPVKVPDLRGKTSVEAEKALDKLGLVGRNDGSVYDDDMPSGCVVSQSPKAGSSSKKGAEVTYKLSKGKELIEVPDVTGYHYRTATIMLEDLGLKVATTYEESATTAEDYVIRQSTTGKVERGTTVTITASLGTPPEPKDLESTWSGTYEGRTDDDEVIWRPFTLRFDTIGNDGTLVGTCRVEVNDDPNKPMSTTFRVEGKVDWRTDEFYVYGTSWIDEGALSDLSNFEGVIDYSTNTMSGVTWIEDERPERTWSASANRRITDPNY